jgi:hypothetical protein
LSDNKITKFRVIICTEWMSIYLHWKRSNFNSMNVISLWHCFLTVNCYYCRVENSLVTRKSAKRCPAFPRKDNQQFSLPISMSWTIFLKLFLAWYTLTCLWRHSPNCHLLYENVLNIFRQNLDPTLASVFPLLHHQHLTFHVR